MNKKLKGFEVNDEAKAQIEAVCPETVSCADIVAFAARDSSYKAGKIYYAVPSGRRDGVVSKIEECQQNVPSQHFNVQQLVENFSKKGFSVDDMVTLSGAHSIGVSHCSTFSNRLYNFSETQATDPSMKPKYAASLKTKCPPTAGDQSNDPTVPFDLGSPNRLDNKYYKDLKKHRGLLTSDQTLMSNPSTRKVVLNHAKRPQRWAAKYAKAMVHMGYVDVLTGSQGEIRRQCSAVNHGGSC